MRPSCLRPLLLTAVLSFTCVVAAPAAIRRAQEPEEAPQQEAPISSEAIQEYLGTWTLTAEFQGNPVRMTLEIAPVEDSVKAALRIPMSPEPQLIESVGVTEDGVDLAYDTEFGGNTARIHIRAALEGDQLIGTFGDEGGFFSADFTGDRAEEETDLVSAAIDAAAAAAEEGASRQRRRFGGATEAQLELGEETIRILYPPLELHSPDGQSFLVTEAGEVFTYPGGRVLKLLTDTDLHFGDTTIAAHNFSPDYPGTYGLWLKQGEDGWQLVFNEQPDVWGTMYDPDYDVATIPLDSSELDDPVEELRVELGQTENGGELRIAWGENLWSSRFTTE